MLKEGTGLSLVIRCIYIYVTGQSTILCISIPGRYTHSFLMTAAVNSEVVAAPRKAEQSYLGSTIYSPPMSAVRTSPALMTSNVAPAILLAMESRLRQSSSDSQRMN